MLLESISIYSPLLPILAFLFFRLKERELPLWVIFFYSLCSLANDSIISYRYERDLSLQPFLAIFTIAEYILYTGILFYTIQNSLLRKVIIVLSTGFILFCLFSIITNQVTNKFDSIQASLESLLIIIYCVFYFFEQINKPQVLFIYSTYIFWAVIAILISLSCTFFLYVFAANLSEKIKTEFWPIQWIGNIIRSLLFALAIIIYSRQKKEGQNSHL